MSGKVLLGDEAIALGAIHAGLSNAYGYPGTPSSEIMGYLLDISKKQVSFMLHGAVMKKLPMRMLSEHLLQEKELLLQ